jgi:hypothetical protein
MEHRMNQAGREFRERFQDESPLVHERVGDRQFWRVYDLVPE